MMDRKECLKAIARHVNDGDIVLPVYSTAFDYLDGPIRRVTGEDVPMPYCRLLEDAAIPDLPRVMEAVKSLL